MIGECNHPMLSHASALPFVRSPRLRLTRRLVVAAALLTVTMSGCGRSSDKAGKPLGTNAATVAPRVVAKTNQALAMRPGVRTNLPPGAPRAAARTNAAQAKAPQMSPRPGAKTNALLGLLCNARVRRDWR